MKKSEKMAIIFIAMLGIVGLFGIMDNFYPSSVEKELITSKKVETTDIRPQIDLTPHDPIFINGSDPTNDWDDCDAITGSGTPAEPYVIRDLEIDCGGTGSGIFIYNSTSYLQIVACKISHSGSHYNNAGIRLENCQNFSIMGCSIDKSQYAGVKIYNSTSGFLSMNSFFNNSMGIDVDDSNFLDFIGNDFINNTNSIIHCDFSNNNLFYGNFAENNKGSISFSAACSDNRILNNTIKYSNYAGIILGIGFPGDMTVKNNKIMGNYLYDCDLGILLVGGQFNYIIGNTIEEGSYGIYYWAGNSNLIISGNKLLNNVWANIYIRNSQNDGFYHNVIKGSENGILIDDSSTPNIQNNWIWDTTTFFPIQRYQMAERQNITDEYPDNFYYPFDPEADTDGDGLTDGEEISIYTDPTNSDTDNDGLSDFEEIGLYTSPIEFDTDGDDYSDGYEMVFGSDPLDPQDHPPVPRDIYDSLIVSFGVSNASFYLLVDWAAGNHTLLRNLIGSVNDNATLLDGIINILNGNETVIWNTLTLLNGNGSLFIEIYNYFAGNQTLLEFAYDLAVQDIEALITLNSLHDINYTAMREAMEIMGFSINDTDADGLDDLTEFEQGTDPQDEDSDDDTYSDGVEIQEGTDPLDPLDHPKDNTSTDDTSTNDTSTDDTATISNDDGDYMLLGTPGYPSISLILLSAGAVGSILLQRKRKR